MKVEMRLNCTGAWTDYSPYVEVTSLKVSKSLSATNDPQKAQTSSIEADSVAYSFIHTNLFVSADRYSNSICVKITDTGCSYSQEFQIDNRDIKWCDGNVCKIEVDLTEYNPTIDCIRNTELWYNATGEFDSYPTSGNPHPRFRYCDVVKPTFIYGFIIAFASAVSAAIIAINAALQLLTGAVIWLLNIFGANLSVPQIGFGLVETLVGCDRAFPAPYVRTYISNVCDTCNLYVDDYTAPWLYNTVYFDGTNYVDNPYYYLCLLTAYTKKGVDIDGAKDFIQANAPSWMLDEFLSKLKDVFNARYFIKSNGYLYFERKDLIGELLWGSGYALDFTGTDITYLLSDVCFQWNGKGKPKRITYRYGTDPSDNIGNELLSRFNGEYLDSSGNPNYTDKIELNAIDFGAVAAVYDGQDATWDEFLISVPGVSIDFRACLKTQGDTLGAAKLVIYDTGTDITDARVIKAPYIPYIGVPAFDDDTNTASILNPGVEYNVNYPLSFDPDADDAGTPYGYRNLWMFHGIDQNDATAKTNIGFEFTLQLCCAHTTLDIYQKILFRDGVTEGEITSLDFDYAKREVLIKGNLK